MLNANDSSLHCARKVASVRMDVSAYIYTHVELCAGLKIEYEQIKEIPCTDSNMFRTKGYQPPSSNWHDSNWLIPIVSPTL